MADEKNPNPDKGSAAAAASTNHPGQAKAAAAAEAVGKASDEDVANKVPPIQKDEVPAGDLGGPNDVVPQPQNIPQEKTIVDRPPVALLDPLTGEFVGGKKVKSYVLREGRHTYVNSDGDTVIARPGDKVPLTPSQALAFADKFAR